MAETATELAQEYRDEIPWVVFRLQKTYFAIYSGNIQAIMVMPGSVTPVPNMQDVFRGIIRQRGEVTPLLDLRLLFGMESTADQIVAFSEIIEQRKQEHISWLQELRRCYTSGEEFVLTIDPHACTFGKWLDSFTSDSLTMSHQLKKVEEPHKRLHKLAESVLGNELPAGEREQQLIKAETELAGEIASILEESKRLFKAVYNGMVIVLADGQSRVGLVVDEVLSVEKLQLIATMESTHYQTEYIRKIAKSEQIAGEILTVDDQLLLALGCGSNFAQA